MKRYDPSPHGEMIEDPKGHYIWVDDLRAAVEAIHVACHSRSGLMCERDEYGWCYLIDRGDVLAVIDGKPPVDR